MNENNRIEMRYRASFADDLYPNVPSSVYTGLMPEPTPDLTTYGGIKLGWIQGVLIPCLLNIWGVMLFLRIAWIVAQAGIAYTILIIIISSIVCVLTTLSLSAICTNGKLKGGGVYFIVSRSLGAELGASVGIIFAFANAVAASMNTIGFCESLNELLKSYNVKIIDNDVNDTRIVGAIALFVMCFICAVGMDWETKTQNFLIVCIVSAIINYIVGALIGPRDDYERAQGFMGVSLELGWSNMGPDFRFSEGEHHDFFSVFAVYFPAVTGVQAGANICGDLKDPATAIPKGTLMALAISISSYFTMSMLSGMGALRDASGNVTNVGTGDLSACKPNCTYGLHNNYAIMHLMALWSPLIYAGCWAATLSTALTNLLSVPRLIQALGVDRIYPGLIFFSKPYGKHGEPYRGYVLVFIVSLLFLIIADLNAIAPLITNFYLASYALINFCTFHAAFFKAINWRPTFKYYNVWLSLVGCIMCVIIMMVISWIMTLVTTFIFLLLYLIVLYRKPETSWGSSGDAQRYQETIMRIMQMSRQKPNPQTFNPQLLVLVGKPHAREWLVDMGKLITSVGSFMIVADITTKDMTIFERRERFKIADKWLATHKARAFYLLVHNKDIEQALIAILQCSGLGSLSPNIMLMGYMRNWRHSSLDRLKAYYRWIELAFEYGLAVAIFNVSPTFRPPKIEESIIPENSDMDVVSHIEVQQVEPYLGENEATGTSSSSSPLPQSPQYHPVQRLHYLKSNSDIDSSMSTYKPLVFHENSTLDAWWLYDDGGLNILLPYIIAKRSCKAKMILRIFVLPRGGRDNSETYTFIERLLAKYRIKYSSLTLVEGIYQKPAQSTWHVFNKMLQKHMTENTADHPCRVSKVDYERLINKTTKHLRLRELLIQHSFKADLIVMTLPHAREGEVPAALYMAWLDIMSQSLPSMLFVRGNHTVVDG